MTINPGLFCTPATIFYNIKFSIYRYNSQMLPHLMWKEKHVITQHNNVNKWIKQGLTDYSWYQKRSRFSWQHCYMQGLAPGNKIHAANDMKVAESLIRQHESEATSINWICGFNLSTGCHNSFYHCAHCRVWEASYLIMLSLFLLSPCFLSLSFTFILE